MSDDVNFEVTEPVVLTDIDAVKETRTILPVSSGVRVGIDKISVRKVLQDNSKEAPKEGPNNLVAYKCLNVNFRVLDGISVPVYDETGHETGVTEIKFKNKVIFSNHMDFVFWHNPEVKTTNWWKNQQYIFGFRQFVKACGVDTKQKFTINDEFVAQLKGKELLLDIIQEEEQEKKDGQWIGKGTFKNGIKNFRAWA